MLIQCASSCSYRGRYLRPSHLEVRLGGTLATDSETGIVFRSVSKMFNHPQYNGGTIVADFALLKLAHPVTFTDTIRPICLPPREVNFNKFKVCVGTGFGDTPSGWLHFDVRVLACIFFLFVDKR